MKRFCSSSSAPRTGGRTMDQSLPVGLWWLSEFLDTRLPAPTLRTFESSRVVGGYVSRPPLGLLFCVRWSPYSHPCAAARKEPSTPKTPLDRCADAGQRLHVSGLPSSHQHSSAKTTISNFMGHLIPYLCPVPRGYSLWLNIPAIWSPPDRSRCTPLC